MKRAKKIAATTFENDILSIRDAGGTGVFGTIGEMRQLMKKSNEPVLSKYGQPMFALGLIDTSGKVTEYWADAGLRGTMKYLNILPGTAVNIVHTGTKAIEQGTVQTYDIYEVTNE